MSLKIFFQSSESVKIFPLRFFFSGEKFSPEIFFGLSVSLKIFFQSSESVKNFSSEIFLSRVSR